MIIIVSKIVVLTPVWKSMLIKKNDIIMIFLSFLKNVNRDTEELNVKLIHGFIFILIYF